MRYIRIKFEQEGIHRWRDCDLSEVEYLRSWHRHMFHFDVKIEVFADDREVEFILLKGRLSSFAKTMLAEPVEFSCETMAEKVLDFLKENLWDGKQRKYNVYVSEDGENGGGILFKPDFV